MREMEVIMRNLILLTTLSACATSFDRQHSPLLRVRIAKTNLAQEEVFVLQSGLQQSQRFFLLDRDQGLKEIELEKDFQKLSVPEKKRYMLRQTYEGAGAILKASSFCSMRQSLLTGSLFARCQQTLSLIGPDSLHLHSATATVDSSGLEPPTWDVTIERFLKTLKRPESVREIAESKP